LPFCAFIYLIFYRKQNLSTKLTALYRGEAIKFILTILFIVVSFKWLGVSQFFLFFTGFFMALVLNNLGSIFAKQVLIFSIFLKG